MTSPWLKDEPVKLESSNRFDVLLYRGLNQEEHDCLYNRAVAAMQFPLDDSDRFLLEIANAGSRDDLNDTVQDDKHIISTSQEVLQSMMDPCNETEAQLLIPHANHHEVMNQSPMVVDAGTSRLTSQAARQAIIEQYVANKNTIGGETFARVSRHPLVMKRPKGSHTIHRERSALTYVTCNIASPYIQKLIFADDQCVITAFHERRDLMHFMQCENDNSEINIPTAPLQQLLQMGDCIFRGIEHLHAHGLRHNDIKPENIFVSADSKNGIRTCIGDLEGCTHVSEKEGAHKTKGYESPSGLGFTLVDNQLKWNNCETCPMGGDVFASSLTVAFLLCHVHPLQMKCEACSNSFIGMCKCMKMPETIEQKFQRIPVPKGGRSIEPFIIAKPAMRGKHGMCYLTQKLNRKHGPDDYSHITDTLEKCFAVMDSERPAAADVKLIGQAVSTEKKMYCHD